MIFYVGKLYEAGSRLNDFSGETGKYRAKFLHMNRPENFFLNSWKIVSKRSD